MQKNKYNTFNSFIVLIKLTFLCFQLLFDFYFKIYVVRYCDLKNYFKSITKI